MSFQVSSRTAAAVWALPVMWLRGLKAAILGQLDRYLKEHPRNLTAIGQTQSSAPLSSNMRNRPANVPEMNVSMLSWEVPGSVIGAMIGGVIPVLRVPPMLPALRVPPIFPVAFKPAMLPAKALEETVIVSATARIVGLSILIVILL